MPKLFIDIETLPSEVMPSPDEITPPSNYKDPAKIRAYQESKVEECYRKQSLDSMKGRILCIGWAVDDEEPQCVYSPDADEDVILATFHRCIEHHPSVEWVGHAIKHFDLLWLCRKSIKYNLHKLAWMIPTARYADAITDTAELWSFTDWKNYCKLDDIAKFLGIPGKNGFDGSMVYDAWLAGEHEKIREYCKDDVRMVREVYQRIMERE